MITAITIFMTGEAFLDWLLANVPLTGVLVFVVWLAWFVRGNIAKYDHEIIGIKNRLDKVEARLDKVETRLDRIEDTLISMDKRLTIIETKFDILIEYITTGNFGKPGGTI